MYESMYPMHTNMYCDIRYTLRKYSTPNDLLLPTRLHMLRMHSVTNVNRLIY